MSIYTYIFTMALTTYLIRVLPLTLFRKPIRSPFIRSFLHYVPYAVLAAMTIPGIFSSTGDIRTAAVGLVVAIVMAWRGHGLVLLLALPAVRRADDPGDAGRRIEAGG